MVSSLWLVVGSSCAYDVSHGCPQKETVCEVRSCVVSFLLIRTQCYIVDMQSMLGFPGISVGLQVLE